MKTPLLFLIFNRPEETRRTFAEIRRARPERLFIAADGPRDAATRPDDARLVAEARAIATSIDWPCETKTLFRASNLGCKRAVSSGIDWFFSQVEEGIILEDDCLPDQAFFAYCEELLARYRSDGRVMSIAGFNAAGAWPEEAGEKGAGSYFFSRYVSIWGWATWRRAWSKYDVGMASWADAANKEQIRAALADERVWKAKQWTYDRVHGGTKDTWDYQWEYAALLAGGLTAVPRVNMIENIGGHDSPARGALTFPIAHPATIESDRRYEAYWTRGLRKDGGSLGARISAKIRRWLT